MATIDYEKKYKALVEAVKTLKEANPSDEGIQNWVKDNVPELKESEDERIRKEIIQTLKRYTECVEEGHDAPSAKDFLIKNTEKLISWLEKQGEQKPIDKVKPKFHEGDWVVCDGWTTQIVAVYEDGYANSSQGFIPLTGEHSMRLWDVSKDAKDGDVLVASDGSIFLFAGVVDWGYKYYAALTTDGAVKLSEGLEHFWETSRAVHPATKEQRDTLEKAMADAGHAFDFEKKELKKIEQKPAWSEEDEKMLQGIWDEIIANKHDAKEYEWKTYDKFLDWLNFLKERVQPQPSKEWSEEDEEMFNRCIKTMKGAYYQDGKALRWLENRFKSLVLQNNWKPSDEQIITLEYYMHTLTCNEHKEVLFGLYTDLKKLKE